MAQFKNRIIETGTADPKTIVANPKNWRTHPEYQKKSLAGMLDEVGWVQDVIINKTTGLLVDGHLRVQLAVERGEKTIPVKYVELTEAEEHIVLATFDPLGELAGRDSFILDRLIDEASAENEDLNAFIDDLLNADATSLNSGTGEKREPIGSEVMEIAKKWDVKPGQLWKIGKHRLLCGSCTEKEDVDRLFGGIKADAIITDPPYGVDYASKNEFLNNKDEGNRVELDIKNDAIEDYSAFFKAFLELAPLKSKNTAYVFMSGKEVSRLEDAMVLTGFKVASHLVWVKNNHVLGRQDYSAKHEHILYGWKGTHKFYGPFRTTVLEYPKPLKNEFHPTMKPIELVAQLISDGTPKKGLVYDPFLGSGTAMLACHDTGRTCFGTEMEPIYCGVILERMEREGYTPELME